MSDPPAIISIPPTRKDKMSDTQELWSASLTSDMVKNLDQDTIDELVEALNDSVMLTCQDYGIE